MHCAVNLQSADLQCIFNIKSSASNLFLFDPYPQSQSAVPTQDNTAPGPCLTLGPVHVSKSTLWILNTEQCPVSTTFNRFLSPYIPIPNSMYPFTYISPFQIALYPFSYISPFQIALYPFTIYPHSKNPCIPLPIYNIPIPNSPVSLYYLSPFQIALYPFNIYPHSKYPCIALPKYPHFKYQCNPFFTPIYLHAKYPRIPLPIFPHSKYPCIPIPVYILKSCLYTLIPCPGMKGYL